MFYYTCILCIIGISSVGRSVRMSLPGSAGSRDGLRLRRSLQRHAQQPRRARDHERRPAGRLLDGQLHAAARQHVHDVHGHDERDRESGQHAVLEQELVAILPPRPVRQQRSPVAQRFDQQVRDGQRLPPAPPAGDRGRRAQGSLLCGQQRDVRDSRPLLLGTLLASWQHRLHGFLFRLPATVIVEMWSTAQVRISRQFLVAFVSPAAATLLPPLPQPPALAQSQSGTRWLCRQSQHGRIPHVII